MLKNTANFMLFVLLGAVLFVTSCKKDPFSEKDALQAQKELLAQKFGYDLAIANVSLQIQRAGDSARIAIQNLVNKGATDLEKEKLAAALALKLADFNYLLSELRAKDSLSRVQDYVMNKVGGLRSYQIRVIDTYTKAAISNASVKVLPWGASQFVTVKTNSDGIAIMTNVIIDPKAIFYAIDDNTGITSATTMMTREAIDAQANPTMELYRGAGTPTTNISGTLRGAVDLTNWSTTQNLGAGNSVTATATITANNGGLSAPSFRISVAGVTNANGSYTIAVPRGHTYTISIPSQITRTQKMFVNWVNGVENPFTTVTRLDSMQVPFWPTVGGGVVSTSPTVNGYYFKLPADSLSGSPVILRDGSSQTFLANLFNNLSRDNRLADGTRTDSLRNWFTVPTSSMVVNNGWERSTDNFYNYAIRLDADGNRVADTLAVEFVNLTVNGLIESMPEFVVITTPNGKLSSIQPRRVATAPTVNSGLGGRFAVTTLTTSSTPSILSYFANQANYMGSTGTGTTNNTSSGVVGTTTITRNFLYGVPDAIYGFSYPIR
jgi:hypothetical protein